MKLQAEYARIMGYTKLWIAKQGGIDKVKEYVEKVRKEGYYDNFEVRIANDVVKYGAMYHVMGVGAVCDMMDKYGCNDSHLTTLCIRIVKELGIIN